MSTFRGVFTCEWCGADKGAHVPVPLLSGELTLACPRPVSQPLSRGVAGPVEDEERCGGPREACGKPGCSECGRASSLIAEVAAFRALSPEQRAALLQIGAGGAALLEAANAIVRAFVAGDGTAHMAAFAKLEEALEPIDARRS